MSPSTKKRHRLRLFWRIYLNGVLLLFVVALAVGAVVLAFGDKPTWMEAPQRLAALLAEDMGAGQHDQARFQRRLDEIHRLMQVDLAVYTPSGDLLGAAGGPLEPPAPADRAELLAGGDDHIRRFGHQTWAAPIGPPDQRRGFLQLKLPRQHPPGTLLALLAAVGLALALATLPLARAIARPLERLTATARALAGGDLEARSGLERSDEVGLLARTMDRMADELVARLRGERELLANVSHELRTPLSRLRVALELAEEDGSDPSALADHLRGMAADVADLSALVENVLLAARLDPAGARPAEVPLSPERLAPGPLLAEAVTRFERLHPDHRLEASVAADLPALEADPVLVRRVVDNLLANAAKASPAAAPIDLEARVEAERLRIRICDRGPGVDPADLPRLFDAFFRTAPGRERDSGGMGLGLTLCKRIVEAHGGRIGAALRPDGGLAVTFDLPIPPA